MVEFIPAAHVRATLQRLQAARQQASELIGENPQPDSVYWQELFEANAAAALAAMPDIALPAGFVVRYRCYGQQGRDILVRPFVARATTDVAAVRRLIDWHPPPDSMSLQQRYSPTQDVELLYRHFTYSHTPSGLFDYWALMQELWASARWTHSQVIASADELSEITSREGWTVLHAVEHYEPAIAQSADSARLAILMQCPLRRFEINLDQIDIDTEQALQYADPILVASGPRGYVL
jgi:hypothetical protein